MVLEAYAAQATREAIESGMARPELIAILDGLSVTELVPPRAGESVVDYGLRATGELMVRHLARDGDVVRPPT